MSQDDLPYSKPAGGWDAVASAVRYTLEQAGPLRGTRALWNVNQPDGFDCPGCAWPDEEHSSRLDFCENGARAVAHEATKRQVDAAFFAEHSVETLLGQSDRWLEEQGRLTEPMILRQGAANYEPIAWPEALQRIAETLRGLDDPDRAIFYTSGRTSNEAAFLYQLFARQFGTNNLPDCSNMCHESSGRGLSEVIGVGKGTVGLHDFEVADTIFVIGQNPGTNHPRMLTTLQGAARRGAKIITVNPLREAGLERFAHPQEVEGILGEGTQLTTRWLQVRIGGDAALLEGLAKAVVEQERDLPGTVLDHTFIEQHTVGFDAWLKHNDTVQWDAIERDSGVGREAIRAASRDYVSARGVIACWAMGITQHKHGVDNVQKIVNLLLLRGNIGKPGAGVCPVRGHSNVQGDRSMGIWEKPPAAFLDRLGAHFSFEPPREHGTDTVAAIAAMESGDASVFVAMGGNFVQATPDTARTAEAVRKCELSVQISTKLNRSHLVTGQTALILPCLGRTEADLQDDVEQFVTVENSMSIVHPSRGSLSPASAHLWSEPAIVARLGVEVFGPDSRVPWATFSSDYGLIRDAIAAVVPGFGDYNLRIRQEGRFLLPSGARTRAFDTPDGQAHFTVHALPDLRMDADELLLMTMRSHDQYNTTIYGDNDRYRGIKGQRRIVFANPDDLEAMGCNNGDTVDLRSDYAGVTRWIHGFVVVSYDVPRGCLGAYFPEANPLVPLESVADKSRTPTSKSIRVRVVVGGEIRTPARRT